LRFGESRRILGERLPIAATYRFGVFEFEARNLDLSREGRPVRLQPQPAQVLLTLLANAGRTVTREELRQAVWKDDTFVDFDRGLNFCIAQIRSALDDDAAAPRFIRTVPKKGYEFIAPVESSGPVEEPIGLQPSRRPIAWAIPAFAALLVLVAAVWAFQSASARKPPIVAVVRFDNETGDAMLARFADNLTDTLTVQLTQAGVGRFSVIGNAAVLRGPRQERDLRTIAASLGARFIVLGQVQRDRERVRVLAHLIRMPEQTHLRVSRTEDVPEPTLTVTDDIAGKIARAFGTTLSDPASRDSRVAATR
jgi:DNA-binding winged helix-turn-helix (wHTH) protein/TolB-like protein